MRAIGFANQGDVLRVDEFVGSSTITIAAGGS